MQTLGPGCPVSRGSLYFAHHGPRLNLAATCLRWAYHNAPEWAEAERTRAADRDLDPRIERRLRATVWRRPAVWVAADTGTNSGSLIVFFSPYARYQTEQCFDANYT